MKLSKENLAHINSIAHDGKVLLFGTDSGGVVWYTVKQSGFEDSVFDDSSTNGFEVWKKLPLSDSTYDASTAAKFSSLFVPVFGKDQAGNENPDSVYSAVAPVQLVSGMGHLHVFRQSTDNKLLVNRFILDGMQNELSPKLEVRFKRSRQKYEISENMKMQKDVEGYSVLNKTDALDFKDMDGNPFYEPTWKLDFIDNLHQGWFSPLLLPTIENDKYRWSIFVYNSVDENVILYTVRASHGMVFDLKDYPFLQPNPKDPQKKTMRIIPGIIKRTLGIKVNTTALVPSNGLAATVYDVQRERVGDDNEPQLLKDATRVMLAVPVKETGAGAEARPKAAVLSFSVYSDGTLSYVEDMPETQKLFAEVNELTLPLNTLDEVKEFIDTSPPPSGVMTGVRKSSDGMVTVLSRNLPDTFTSEEQVKISGTKNYNGLYTVTNVIKEKDGTKSIEIEATFTNSEAGFWEVVPKTQNDLTFDNMVVGYRKAGDDLLKVVCTNHNLETGDEVQVTGTRNYDGLYPVKAVDEANNSFTIDMDYQPGEAVDLKAKKRRGIRFEGGEDYLRISNVKLDPFVIDDNGGRTVSAWVWLETTKSQTQLIVSQNDYGIKLEVDVDAKLQLKVQLDDNSVHTIKDPDTMPLKTWVHFAGVVDYKTGSSKETHLYLCKNGVKVTPVAATGETIAENEKVIANRYPKSNAVDSSPQPADESVQDSSNTESQSIQLFVGGEGEDTGSFTGKISELRIWNTALDEETIQNGMHMPLNGREENLAGNWRMGAIVLEKGTKAVPDFSVHSNNALVYGTPFVSERSLNRKTHANQKIVRYANDELVAVSQRARYRESFEFKIQGENGNVWNLNQLNNADGRNNDVKLFRFAFWGKISRSSEKSISLSSDLYSQEEFSAVTGAAGWFKASCEFTVPDGVAMVRTFDIADIKGLWGSETVPPTSEWTTMEIRKHQIEQISDAITQKSYADSISLQTLGGGTSGTTYDLWEEIRSLELCEADLSRHLQHLVLRIDIVSFRTKYETERSTKEGERDHLATQIASMTERDNWLRDEIKRLSDSIQKKSAAYQASIDSKRAKYQEWRSIEDRHRRNRDHFRNELSKWYNFLVFGRLRDLERKAESARIEANSNANRYYNEWQAESRKKNQVISALSAVKRTYESEKAGITTNKPGLESQKRILDRRLTLLNQFLGGAAENLTDLTGWQTTTQEGLAQVRATLNTKNTEFLRTLAENQLQPQEMGQVNIDSNKLVTWGALLSFVSPKSRLHAIASARGNVELNYFDSLDKLQCTAYDATADSRNTAFEQWIPSSLHSAVEFREATDKMYFEGNGVSMASRWSMETWFQYPLVAQASGDVFETQVLIEDRLGRQIVVKEGKYLGAEAGGKFFETGIDLDKLVNQGWHHLAVTVEKDNGLAFYLDGVLQGKTPKKYTLSFSGSNTNDSADYVKWTSFENFPRTEFTLALWVKTLGRNNSPTPLSYWASNQTLYVSLANQLIVCIGGETNMTSTDLDDGFWHHLAVTWTSDTGALGIYKDGDLIGSRVGFKQNYSIPGNGTLVVGQKQGSAGGSFGLSDAFDGVMHGLSIWNSVRDAGDIRRDMYTTFKGTENNLVGYWPMESFNHEGKLKIKDVKATDPQHGEIAGSPLANIVSLTNESSYKLKTVGNSADGGKPFGRLAEIRLWSQPLSDEEIAAHARTNTLTGNEPGLVAYYPMNEANGSTVRDHTAGSKIHGTLSGADWKACTGDMSRAASDKPKFKVLSFSGNNNYVEIPGLSGQLGGTELTIEYWFRGSLIQSAVRQQSGSSYIVSAWRTSGVGHILSNDGGTSNVMSAGDVQSNEWHHVAMTWHRGQTDGFVTYLDGGVVAKKNAGSSSIPSISNSLFLGAYNAGSEFTKGEMAEVRIWTKSRTQEEIITNMHQRLTGKETGLKACYPLDSFMEIGGSIKVRDVTPNGYHGTVQGATLVDVEDILINDNIDRSEVLYFDSSQTWVDCGDIDLANKSFSVETWVKNANPGSFNFFILQGEGTRDKGLHIGYRNNNQLSFDFLHDGVSSSSTYSDKDWHHVACTYDHTTRTQTIYRDGAQVGQRTADAHYSGAGSFRLNSDGFYPGGGSFQGSLDDIRVWNRALSQEEIQSRRNRRLSGEESGLIAYWPIVDIADGKLKDRSAEAKDDGTINGANLVEASAGLPFSTVVTDLTKASISACEYATMGLDPEKPGLKTSMLRSFRAFSAKPGEVDVLCDLRIEGLELKWVGNAQFKPTLLGFIEGAPPVPSENLTVDYDYNNATTVTLRESQDVSYTWNRTKDISQGLDLDLFLGVGWGVSGGIGIETTISEGRAGFKGSLNTRFVDSNSSNITSGSTISFNDALALRGEQERGIKFPHLGKRFVPKNVGYALVVSGLADIFITRLLRSRRMISYEMRPVEGVPLDINTITFHINPAYTMNGSLDGLTGTQPTSDRFFRHIPEMRAQYGSLYPASYYRIKEAYNLKEQIEQWDKEREAYFWNFDVTWRPGVDPERQIADPSEEGSYGQVSVEREEDKTETDDGDDEKSDAQKADEKIDKLQGDMEKEKDKAKAKAKERKDEINKRFHDPEARERAAAALDGWQSKMENLLIRAGKRNIVNTYVWDANGGLRAESQDFANTIEHTIGSNFTIGGTLGGLVDAQITAFKVELTALYAGELTQTSSKTENIGKTFGLDVDLFGLESKEVTNLEGKPLKPAEKVARYRFMSIYLGGNTNNFHDFFDYVVDPEWLAGNSEGARALRQAQTGKPNKSWRVLHRVTYVERPALEGVGVDTRRVSGEDQVTEVTVNYFDSLEKKSRAIQAELATVVTEMRKQRELLDKLADGA